MEAHKYAINRMVQAGAVPITWQQVLLEWQPDWVRKETYCRSQIFLGRASLRVPGGVSMNKLQALTARMRRIPEPAPTNEVCSWACSSTAYGMVNGMTRCLLAVDLCARIAHFDGAVMPKGQGPDEFPADPNRYHLYVSLACPWAHRTLIMRALKGLEEMIPISVVHWRMLEHGWTFDDGPGVVPDPIHRARYLHQVYAAADPDYTGRVTVPVLWDR